MFLKTRRSKLNLNREKLKRNLLYVLSTSKLPRAIEFTRFSDCFTSLYSSRALASLSILTVQLHICFFLKCEQFTCQSKDVRVSCLKAVFKVSVKGLSTIRCCRNMVVIRHSSPHMWRVTTFRCDVGITNVITKLLHVRVLWCTCHYVLCKRVFNFI